jgi:hypothetical protein
MSLQILSCAAATAIVLFSLTMTPGVAGQCIQPVQVNPPPGCPENFFDQLRNATCTNCNKFPRGQRGPEIEIVVEDPSNVNTRTNNPFFEAPYSAYDVNIDSNVDCYVKIDRNAKGKKGDLVYSLSEKKKSGGKSGKLHLTHTNQCGVCSDLNSLASFMQFPAFEQEIARCGFSALPSILAANNLPVTNPQNVTELVMQLGKLNGAVRLQQLRPVVPSKAFQELESCVRCVTKLNGRCLNLWSWNVIEAMGKCGLECLRASSPPFPIPANNPFPFTPNPPNSPISEAQLCLQGPSSFCPNYCKPASLDNLQGCPVTINGEQACYSEAYEDENPFRLNLCLQCDECYNGQKLVEVGGRVRRNSGIGSGIKRPSRLIPNITVDYGLCGKSESTSPSSKATKKSGRSNSFEGGQFDGLSMPSESFSMSF